MNWLTTFRTIRDPLHAKGQSDDEEEASTQSQARSKARKEDDQGQEALMASAAIGAIAVVAGSGRHSGELVWSWQTFGLTIAFMLAVFAVAALIILAVHRLAMRKYPNTKN